MTATVPAEHVLTIAQDTFTALVDGEPGHLSPAAEAAILLDPVHAWVQIEGDPPVRVLTAAGRDAAELITRALLRLGPHQPVDREDVRDALGELANVVGGNVKALMPQPGALSLPLVTFDAPAPAGASLLWECALRWHREPVTISMWTLHTDGKEQSQ